MGPRCCVLTCTNLKVIIAVGDLHTHTRTQASTHVEVWRQCPAATHDIVRIALNLHLHAAEWRQLGAVALGTAC